MFTRFSLRALRAHSPSAALAQRSFTQTSALAPHISRLTQNVSLQSSRWISNQPLRRPTLAYHYIPGARPSTHRAFTSTSHPKAQYNRSNQYNRFNNRGSLFYTLIQNSRPHHFVIIGIGLSGIYFYNTDVVSETGRRRFICVSTAQELKFGEEGYREALNEARGKILPDYHPLVKTVDRVLQRLIPLAPIEGAEWKVHVIKDDGMANAFVLPGGKVFVYTGILPICENEDGLAAVLGHEIAHVVARHPAERMSNSFLTLGAVFAVSLLFDVSGQLTSFLVNLMYSLPNSRSQEAEADNIGLMMMSKACFNPEAAVRLWARMQKQEKGSPPQFMSTHPSSYNREEAIRGWLEKAETIYSDNGCGSLGKYMPAFHDAAQSYKPSYGW
ncbi:hypothetical protein N7448_005430 [Penicillium atrosanguineum]|nr:hypothetical protein N7526_008295 [Penicillium atrosanguineum]KAJ5136876.1 hypothetical protein N7448_005430 [Penicillium atrosanguineum]